MFGGRKPQSTQSSTPVPTPPTSSSSQAVQPSAPTPVRQPVGFETVLGANTTFKGDLKSKANVRIDGQFEGALDIEGNILVGETARVTADIHAKNEVRVAGAVRGNVVGRKVHLTRTGRVWGDINTAALTTEEGAYIDGKISMGSHPAGMQGFSALPAPEVSILYPMSEDGPTPDTVEGEVLDEVEHHEVKAETKADNKPSAS